MNCFKVFRLPLLFKIYSERSRYCHVCNIKVRFNRREKNEGSFNKKVIDILFAEWYNNCVKRRIGS